MTKIINSKHAPDPVGPYNQAVLKNGFLFTSGQIGINPATGDLITDSIENETKQVMANVKEVLKAADMDFSNVIKATIFISDMEDFGKINEVYGSYFNEKTAPARETVEVANLPRYANIEISVIAAK